MRPSSCKAKGRRAAAETREMLLASAPHLEGDDIIVTPSGVPGEDLRLSPLARRTYPFQFENKNVEKINIWEAIEQSRTHGKHTPAVVFKRNNQELHIVLKLKDFLAYVAPLLNNIK